MALAPNILICDDDPVVHEQIRPVLGHGLGQSRCELGAVDVPDAVEDAVIVEAADLALVPLVPEVDQGVPGFRDGGEAELTEFIYDLGHAGLL